MKQPESPDPSHFHAHCCPCVSHAGDDSSAVSRRGFLGGVSLAMLGSTALQGMTWQALAALKPDDKPLARRRPLVVKPVFFYSTSSHRPMTSWRPWGGVETQAQADEEMIRIGEEIKKLTARADFPVKFLPVTPVKGGPLSSVTDLSAADVVIAYASSGNAAQLEELADSGKDVIVFVRHKSGPLYFYYEAVSPFTLRRRKNDRVVAKSFAEDDVVVDSQDEILWRLRALCGLRNTIGTRIVALGGPLGWGIGPKAAELAKERFKLEIETVTYEDLKKLLGDAMADPAAVKLAKQQAADYLKLPGTKLETGRDFLERSFLLTQVFKRMMKQADCTAFTIGHCMGAPMPIARTTACMPLSLMNDEGYLAFCESDFVVIPAGMLLANISGRPSFLNDPTYPKHDGIITLAHCTAPRKMDGKHIEPARILTHFESDYGAAPKVEMRKGQLVTNLIPGFDGTRWAGLYGEIVDAPFLPICRSQIDVRFKADPIQVAKRMGGFHWITGYGDSMREVAYALRRLNIEFDKIG